MVVIQLQKTPSLSAPSAQVKIPSQVPDLLLIIQGNYRTLDLTIDSILRNLCVNQDGGCHIILSLASAPEAISKDVELKLAPYLVASYFAEPTDERRPYYIFEYYQTLKVFNRFPHIRRYSVVARVRADCYISVPFPIMSVLGLGANFAHDWLVFEKHWTKSNVNSSAIGDLRQQMTAWLFAGGIPSLLQKTVFAKPAPWMPWSPMDCYQMNGPLLAALLALPQQAASIELIRAHLQALIWHYRVLFISGGLFLHFGHRKALHTVTQTAFEHWKRGPGVTLNWRTQFPHLKAAQNWQKPVVQEANVRLAHHYLGYGIVDLHNFADYVVSFSWKHYGFATLTRARGLSIWILRSRQVDKFKYVHPIAKRFWQVIDNVSYVPPPTSQQGGRLLSFSHGCNSESQADELNHCVQSEIVL